MKKTQTISLFEDGSTVYLKKHSSIIQINNITTLQQRKSINVLMRITKQVLRLNPDETLFRIDMGTLKRIAGIKDTNNIGIKKALQTLTKTQVEYNVLGKDTEVWGAFNILSEVSITTKKGENICFIEFGFPSKIINAIKNPRMYSKLDLFIIRDLNSKYSVAMYELLKDYQKLGEIVFSVDDFKRLMGVDDKKYSIFTMFEKRVIKQSVEEINQKTDLQISYQTRKQGRKYTEIAFKVKVKEHEEIVNVIEGIDIQLQQFGFSQEEIKKIKDKHDENYIMENIKIVQNDYKKGKIKNLQAYMKTSFEKDFRPQKTEYEKQIEGEKEEKKRQEEELKRKKEDTKKQKSLFEAERRKGIETLLGQQEEKRKKELERDFLELKKTNTFFNTIYSKGGINNPMIYPQWLDFVEKRLSEDNMDFNHTQEKDG